MVVIVAAAAVVAVIVAFCAVIGTRDSRTEAKRLRCVEFLDYLKTYQGGGLIAENYSLGGPAGMVGFKLQGNNVHFSPAYEIRSHRDPFGHYIELTLPAGTSMMPEKLDNAVRWYQDYRYGRLAITTQSASSATRA